jgi:hypothetical protein
MGRIKVCLRTLQIHIFYITEAKILMTLSCDFLGTSNFYITLLTFISARY